VIYRGIGGLEFLLLGDGGVHVDQTQEVETQGRSQAAKQPGRYWTKMFFCERNAKK